MRRGYSRRARIFITAYADFQQRGMVLLQCRSLQDLAHRQALALAKVKHRVGAGLMPGYGPAKITADPYAPRLNTRHTENTPRPSGTPLKRGLEPKQKRWSDTSTKISPQHALRTLCTLCTRFTYSVSQLQPGFHQPAVCRSYRSTRHKQV